jgi:hypothetical protein
MPPARPLRALLPLLLMMLSACTAAPADVDDVAEEEEALQGDRRIDPIEVGHAWTYDVKVLGYYPLCTSGSHTATTLESVRVGGREAKRVQSVCSRAGTFLYAVEGDRVWSWWAGAWRLSLDAPVRSGHVWSDDYADYTWERVGTVTVPAGTFKTCWSATKLSSRPSYTIFCRGVGPVHWHYEDTFGNGYDAQLTSKNF